MSGIPYVEAQFDKSGTLQSAVSLPAGTTDLLVISHGWNNTPDDARGLYRGLFASFVASASPGDLAGRALAIIGVIWPSKRFDEMVAVAAAATGVQGSAGMAMPDPQSQQVLLDKLRAMQAFFAEPAQKAVLDEAMALVPDLEEHASARRAFVDKIRSLLDRSAAGREDASDSFFKQDGNELMKNLKVDEDDLEDDVAGTGGSASLPLGVPSASAPAGGAAGLKEIMSGFNAAALNVLNFTTYFEMKTRAGSVGSKGLAPLIDRVDPDVARIHLIGHSFGGRLVTAAAASSKTQKIATLCLLQSAFSHNGFSKSMSGFFRAVVDQGRIHGPILVTHSKNDTAVGLAYPLASRISGDRTAGFGDETDVFGGLGRNGAQQMQPGETVTGKLLAAGSSYTFAAGRFFNLEASEFIKEHSDITGREVASAVRRAIAG
jgi:hypothetical protein